MEDVETQLGFKIVGKKEPLAYKESEPSVPDKQQPVAQSNNSLGLPDNVPDKLPCGCVVVKSQATDGTLGRYSNNNTAQTKPHDILDTQQLDTTALEQALFNQIETLLAEANSFDDAYESLLDAYPHFAIDELEAALFKTVANSALLAEAEPG